MPHRLNAAVLAGLLLCCAAAHANECNTSGESACATAGDPLQSCRDALAADPLDVDVRLSLCQLLVESGEMEAAQRVLEEGRSMCGRRSDKCRTLEVAASNVKEARESRNREDPNQAERVRQARRAYCVGPLSTERTITACQDLLVSDPRDMDLYAALSSKLLKAGRPTEALSYLSRARGIGTLPDAAKALQAQAEREREVLVQECLNDNSMEDCNHALLPGAGDEYLIQRQRGQILSRQGQRGQALRALLTAQSLRENDRETALAVVALDRTGLGRADRIELLAAQSVALRTLGNTGLEKARLVELLAAAPGHSLSSRLRELNGGVPIDPPPDRDDIAPPPLDETPIASNEPDPVRYANSMLASGQSH